MAFHAAGDRDTTGHCLSVCYKGRYNTLKESSHHCTDRLGLGFPKSALAAATSVDSRSTPRRGCVNRKRSPSVFFLVAAIRSITISLTLPSCVLVIVSRQEFKSPNETGDFLECCLVLVTEAGGWWNPGTFVRRHRRPGSNLDTCPAAHRRSRAVSSNRHRSV